MALPGRICPFPCAFERKRATFPPMARRPVTRELYAKLVAGFTDAPGNFTHAARVAGCERRMAKRGWEDGWPIYAWAEPIRKVVERETQARQERERAEEVERARQAARVKDAAREDAQRVHQDEGRLVNAARVNVLVLLNATGRLGPSLQVLSDQIRQQIDSGTLDAIDSSNLLRNLASTASQMVRAGQIALQLERLYRGDPTQIVGVQPMEAMSPEQAAQEIEAAQEALVRYQRRGLELIEGGQQTITVNAGHEG